MEGKANHFLISGEVQGVSYRAATRDKAAELGLRGWVRNLPDGRVEALVLGEAAAVGAIEQWLWQGPQKARVDQVVSQKADEQLLCSLPKEGFIIQRL